MSLIDTAVAGPIGVGVGTSSPVTVWNRCGATVALGDVVMFDMNQAQAETTTFEIGNTASGFANVVNTITAFHKHGLYAVVVGLLQGAGADNTKVKVQMKGVLDVAVEGANACALADVLVAPDNGSRALDSDGTTGRKVLGIPLATTAAGTKEVISVLFDGEHGLGAA